MFNAYRDNTKHLYWDGREQCYVALMANCPTCSAEGATPAEALQNVERAYAQGRSDLPPVTMVAAAGSRITGYMAVR